MRHKPIRIATRQSPLALWQANHVRSLLLKNWPDLEIELLPMTTSGDTFLQNNLQAFGGKGLFVKELEEALLAHRADLAVHSMKDVPAHFPPGLCLAAICSRHNPYDAFVSDIYPCLNALPQGATIGTISLRRQSQLLAIRPDLIVKPLRGNIHTRLQKMQQREYDAIILAVAGLERMGLHHLIQEIFDEEVMLPAPGQGALGIECRINDHALQALLAPIEDPLSSLCVHTERKVNAQLGGNCHTPVAIFCKLLANHHLLLQAGVFSGDGTIVVRENQQGLQKDADTLAEHCVRDLLAKGALELLSST